MEKTKDKKSTNVVCVSNALRAVMAAVARHSPHGHGYSALIGFFVRLPTSSPSPIILSSGCPPSRRSLASQTGCLRQASLWKVLMWTLQMTSPFCYSRTNLPELTPKTRRPIGGRLRAYGPGAVAGKRAKADFFWVIRDTVLMRI